MSGGATHIGASARRAARRRQFHWCRRPNGFCDLPIWGVVADRLEMPAYQVIAFVNRLEELGNAAANFGGIRGHLGRFNPLEFARALGMGREEVERIYEALAAPDIGWIADDHIVDFYDRNPDREDETNAERQRRFRLRKSILQQLSKLARTGRIAAEERAAIEGALEGSEATLRELKLKLAAAELGPPQELSTAPVDNAAPRAESGVSQKPAAAESVTRYYQMSQCDIVTVTPEKSKVITPAAGDNFTGLKPVEPEGWPKVGVEAPQPPAFSYETLGEREQAERWIEAEGYQLVQDMMRIPRASAQTKLERWLRRLDNDPPALAQTLLTTAAAADPNRPAVFQIMMDEAIKRRKDEAKGPRLPLPIPLQVVKGRVT
uniref:Uncharacterized protein n=1 Tax=Rhodopseudomonas palustris (strain DX-1) TaxID=652103 RepID=E6VFK3_RHOPX